MIKRRPATRKLLAVMLASALFMQSSVSSFASAAATAPDEEITSVVDALEDADADSAENGAVEAEDLSDDGEQDGGAFDESDTDSREAEEVADDDAMSESESDSEAEEAVDDASDEEILDEESELSSVDTIDKSSLLGRGGLTTLEGDYYVTGAAQAVDKNALENYVGDDGIYDDYLTGSQKGDQSLFTAVYNDMLYERQGGKWYNGHEVIHYGTSSKKVYDPTNYAYVIDKDETTIPVDMGDDTPSTITADDMVFMLDYLPVELSDQYVHGVDNGDTRKLSGVKLYAWEYAESGDRFERISAKEIPADSYELFEEEGVTYTNSSFVHDATVASTLQGAVTLNSSIVGSSENYIAIVAMIYDASHGSGETVRNLARGENQDIWENDPIWYNLSDYYLGTYTGSYNNYVDDMYSAASMGSFSLRAYSYYKDEDAGTVTLYRGLKYYSYGYQAATGKFGTYVDVRNIETAADPIDTWEIPVTYYDPYDKESYSVILANEPNYMFDDDDCDGLNCGFLYPALAVNLIIDEGVTFPSDCSYFLNNNYWINNLQSFRIEGSAASVGGNITKLAYFMVYDLAHTDKKWASIDVSALDTGSVTDMSYMFENVTIVGDSSSNIDVSHFNTSNVTNFEGMFHNYRVTDMNVIRHYYSNVDVSSWDTSKAENMSYMFAGMWFNEGAGAGCGTLDVSGLDFTSNLKNMRAMFAYNIRLLGEGLVKIILPSTMDTSNVLDMALMFQGDASLSEIVNLDKLSTGSVIDMSAMFGACYIDRLFPHRNTYYEILADYMTPVESAGTTGSWIFDRTWFNDSSYYMYDDDYPGPEIESLDLSGFDTRNVRYAYGMFCYMPALTEIKWGPDTTFENVTDATAMFVLPGINELDLTGRKLTSIRYAHIMLALREAYELILGADSLALSNIAADGRFSVSGPMAVVDFSNVDFGTNIHALDANSLFNGEWTIYNPQEGLISVEELRFPADMPIFAEPAALRQTFFDQGGDSFDYVYGGNSEPMVLTTSASGYQLERLDILARVGKNLVTNKSPESLTIDLEDTASSYLDNRDIIYHFSLIAQPYVEGSDEFKELTPAPDIRWTISDPSVLEVVYTVGYTNTNDEIMVLAKKTGTAKVTVTVNDELTRSVDITVYGDKTNITSADGSKYTGVKLPDNTYMITGYTSVAAGDTLDLAANMTVGGSPVTISRIGKCAFEGSWSEELQDYPEIKERIAIIRLPVSLRQIDYGAFRSLDKVTLVDIPEGSELRDVGDNAFSNLGCTLYVDGSPEPETVVSLENATKLERIGAYAFSEVPFLKTVVLPEDMTFIGNSAFYGCKDLAEVTMPTGLTAIPSWLFDGAGYGYGASGSTNLTITNLNDALAHVTAIGEGAFRISGGLDGISVEAPALLSLGDSAFTGTDIVAFSAPNLTIMGVTAYSGSGYGNAFSGCKMLTTASIPLVKEISANTFSNCEALSSVDISSAVVIGNGAFSGTKALTDIRLHEGITTIDDNAFSNSGLVAVELPESLRTIGRYAFSGSSITSFVVPDGVTRLGEHVCSYCDSLTTIYIGDGVTEIPNCAFVSSFDHHTVDWVNKDLSNIHIGDNVTVIGERAFEGVNFKKGIKLPESLKTIGREAFNESYNGTVPGSGYDAAEDGVSAIEIPYGVTSIPNKSNGVLKAFKSQMQRSYIEELYLPYTIKDICGLDILGLFLMSDEEFEYDTEYGKSSMFRYNGTVYYPGTKEELLEVIFGENDSTYNDNGMRFGLGDKYTILDLIDVEYGTGFKEEGGRLVFYKKGVPVSSDEENEIIEKIGAYYYLLDENGHYLTDRTYIAYETVDSVTTTYIYYFDPDGRGERKEITAADISAGSRVYSFNYGSVHGAMKVADGVPVTVAGSSDVPTASPSSLTAIGSEKYFGFKNGVLAKGYLAGRGNDGFYFDDYRAEDGRLLWYADFATGTYYTDETKAALLGGSEGIVLKDERGALVTFKNGKMISLTNDDLSITSIPAFTSGTTMVLFTGGDASEDSISSPSKGVFKVTVDTGDKGTDLTGAGVKWSISSSYPMVGGTKVVSLSEATELTDGQSQVTIRSVAAGSAKIRATLTDSEGNTFYREATVTVKELDEVPTGIRLNASSTKPIPYNGTVVLTAILLPENKVFKPGFDKVTWATSDASGMHSYADITDNGDGTAILTGKWDYWGGHSMTQKVTVIATTRNGKSARMTFTVTAEDTPIDPDEEPKSVTINCPDSEKVVYVGGNYKLTAVVLPAEAPQDVTWTSSDPSVATVNGGSVTGVKSGEVTITAASTYDPGINSSVKLTVRARVSSIALNTYAQSVPAGKTFKLIATLNDGVDKADMGIKWVSSDASVATVDQNGVVTARSAASVAENKVEIKAISTVDESVESLPCVITVYDPITSLKFSTTKVSLGAGKGNEGEEYEDLILQVLPYTASCDEVEFTSSDTGIVTCPVAETDNEFCNTIRLKLKAGSKTGKATITALAKDGSGKKAVCTVTTGRKVDSFRITAPKTPNDDSMLSLAVGKTLKLGTEFNGGNKADQPVNKTVVWSIDSGREMDGTTAITDKDTLATMATIDPDKGIIKALKPGFVTVTATHEASGTPITREVRLFVSVSKLSLSENKITIKEGRNDYAVVSYVTDGATIFDGTSISLVQDKVTWDITKCDVDDEEGKPLVKVKNDEGAACELYIGMLPEGKTKATATLTATAISDGNNGTTVKKTANCTITVVKSVAATKVLFDKTKVSAGVGSSFELTASVTPMSADDTDIVFISSVPEAVVVTPAGDGKATVEVVAVPANAKKQAVITATNTASGKKATCTVTVGGSASKVEITNKAIVKDGDNKTMSLIVGKNNTLKANVTAADGSKAANTGVDWTITKAYDKNNNLIYDADGDGVLIPDNPAIASLIATVDAKGKVIAKDCGKVVVKASTKEMKETTPGECEPVAEDTVEIVTYKPVTKLVLSALKRSIGETIDAGDTKIGSLWISQIAPNNAFNPADPGQTIHWTSSAPDVIVIAADATTPEFGANTETSSNQKLLFKAIAPSKKAVTITATTNDGSKKAVKCTVTVLGAMKEGDVGIQITSKSAKALVNVVTVSPGYDTVAKNLKVTGLPLKKSITLTSSVTSTASDKKVVFTSSNTSVATVNAKGVVTAKGSGEAVIAMVTEDGGFEATCTVTVP